MNEENPFPHDLLELQERLHRAHAEYRAYLATLPWSGEPMKGWPRGERFSHRGDVPDSPGWSDEQKATADRMWAEIGRLSVDVSGHPYWKSVPTENLVASRMQLKRQARPAESPEDPEAAEAA
ncbi:hypothetical protein AB0469_26345 [Streptomyces sp. NPDC093801]|uniref:hypothetical protein n=1 Tax=Streptomyces sp. NPDC093801 TaxID=3155203 RepID=UPI00344D4A0F